MTDHSGTAPDRAGSLRQTHEPKGWSPAQIYLWATVTYLTVLGVGSLVVNPSFATGEDATVENLFGRLETNGWHGLAGLLLGFAALAFALSRRRARLGSLVVGAFLIGSSLVFFLSGDESLALGLIPVDFTDAVALHLVPGIVGLVCAAISPRIP